VRCNATESRAAEFWDCAFLGARSAPFRHMLARVGRSAHVERGHLAREYCDQIGPPRVVASLASRFLEPVVRSRADPIQLRSGHVESSEIPPMLRPPDRLNRRATRRPYRMIPGRNLGTPAGLAHPGVRADHRESRDIGSA
jgi:hypothetical protein